MPMVPCDTKLGKLALRETRSIYVRGRSDLPDGEYGLLESYCDEPGCDCRRVLFVIYSRAQPQQPLAYINYGWAPREFYARRTGDDGFDYCGPYVEPLAPQSKHAAGLLNLVRIALSDPDYVERLKRHYAMFRDAAGGRKKPKPQQGCRLGGRGVS